MRVYQKGGEAVMKWKIVKRLVSFSMIVMLLAGSVNLTGIAADTTQYKGDEAQDGQLTTGTFEKESDLFYGTATFYDYYSEPEMEGVKLSQNPFGTYVNGKTYSYDRQAILFNEALSGYYEQKGYTSSNNKYPMYMGGNAGFNNGAWYGFQWISTVNGWDNDKHLAMGLVDNYTKEGMIVQNGIAMPYFNSKFLRGENVFNTAIGQVYSDVQFPFTKNSDGYWEFQSIRQTDSLELKKSENKGYYLERRTTAVPNPNGFSETPYGFFPLEQYGSSFSSATRNNMFGMHMDIPFYMTSDGQIKMSDGTKKDVVFEFAGDDDVWIFIDGVLVLDVGGIHGANGGSINFRTGEVSYKESYDDVLSGTKATATNLSNLTTSNGKNLLDSIRDGEKHKICIFYLERGLHDSNLHIKFNFQVQSKLTVEKSVNTVAANTRFEGILKNIDAFDFYLYNQAVTGETLAVEDSVGYIGMAGENVLITGEETSGLSVVNGMISFKGNVLYDAETTIRYSTSGWLYIPSASEWHSVLNNRLATMETSFNVADYTYLKMGVRCTSASQTGEELYIRLNYTDGTSWGDTADKLTYQGNSNYIGASDWSTVYIDLSNADRKEVKSISIAYRTGQGHVFYINEISGYGSWDLNESSGFSVEQYQISDYTSIANGKLMPAKGAFFEKWTGETKTVYSVDKDGKFSLANGQTAVFTDKFRMGSYLYLHEIMTEEQQKIFDTTYTMYEAIDNVYTKIEKDSLAADKKHTVTIQNSGDLSSLTNVTGYTVSDERTSIVEGTAIAANESGLPVKNEASNTFVYRNYADPDSTEEKGVDLKIDYVNTLKTGSVTVKKVLQWKDENSDGKDDTSGLDWETFKSIFIKSDIDKENESVTFRLTFTNIAGQDLEGDTEFTSEMNVFFSEYDDVTRTITGEGVFAGIPSGTQYKVEELQTGGMRLQQMEPTVKLSGKEEHKLLGDNNTGISGKGNKAYGEAVAYQGDAEYTYINCFVKTQDIKVIKYWDESVKDVKPNTQVTVSLQRKTSGEDWEVVGEQKTINLSTTFTNLPTTDADNNRYEYKVVEVAIDNQNVSDFVVFYTVHTDGNYTVINASVDRMYYVQRAVERELPILPENETDKQQVYDNYTITIRDMNDVDVTAIYFDVLQDGTIIHNASTTGTALYKVTFTPKKDNSLVTQTINVAIHTYDVDDDFYVLDYAKEVSLNLFENDTYAIHKEDSTSNEVVGVTEATSESYAESAAVMSESGKVIGNGILALERKAGKKDADNTSVIFTPTRFMSSKDAYLYKNVIRSSEALNESESAVEKNAYLGVVMTAEVNILPANNVYYEDTFVTDESTGTVGIVYSGAWITDGTSSGNTEKTNGKIHGWEESLSDDTGYSDGSAHMSNTPGARATFTFTGTGVDVYSRTDKSTGLVIGMLYKGDSIQDENGKNKVAEQMIWMDTLSESSGDGAYYQIPTMSFCDLEYGTYTVMLTVAKDLIKDDDERMTYYLDGIRVYNPLRESSDPTIEDIYGEAEANAVFKEVRDCLLENGSYGDEVSGAVFIDKFGDKVGYTESQLVSDFETFGPKNEVYLGDGQLIAFVVSYDPGAHYYVGMKSISGDTIKATYQYQKSKKQIEIQHTADLYYEVTPEWKDTNNDGVYDKGIISIANSGAEGVLGISKLKITNPMPEAVEITMFSRMSRAALVSYASTLNMNVLIEDETKAEDKDSKQEQEEVENVDPQEIPIDNLGSISKKLFADMYSWF